jgi:Tfp pilus assembly pilus retraction ATPase PilT
LEAQKKGGVNPLPAAITIATTTSDQQQQASAILVGDLSIKSSKKRKKSKEKVKNNGSAGSDDDIDSGSSSNGESSDSDASSDGEVDFSTLLNELKKLLTNTLKKRNKKVAVVTIYFKTFKITYLKHIKIFKHYIKILKKLQALYLGLTTVPSGTKTTVLYLYMLN